MKEIAALKQLLKAYAETKSIVTQGFLAGLCAQAKAAIEQLQTENDRLNTAIDNRAEDKVVLEKYKKVKAELDRYRWIPVAEEPPGFLPGTDQSKKLEIIDNGSIYIGYYHNGKYEYSIGLFHNIDNPDSQKNITHYRYAILPEQALSRQEI